MSKLNCEVVRDLLPLCQDGVASKESTELVEEHLKDCPSCREELAKLSAPVAVPPEEDGKEQKIRERLQESVRELKRIKRIKIAVLLAALAILALSSLWYNRPRSFADIAGDWDFTRLNAYLSFDNHDEKGYRTSHEYWQLELTADGDPDLIMEQFRIALSREYRFPLSSITHNLLAPHGTIVIYNCDGDVHLSLEREYAWVDVSVYNDSAHTVYIGVTDKGTGKSAGRFCFQTEESLYDILFQLVQDHGELNQKTYN